jgi:hypothetical protein
LKTPFPTFNLNQLFGDNYPVRLTGVGSLI